MSDHTLKESLQAFGLNRALGMMRTDPEKNLPKLLNWVDRLDTNNAMLPQRDFFRKILNDPDNIWYQFMLDLWKDIDESVRVKFFENFIVNAAVIGYGRQNTARAKYDCNIPWAILMDPTSACNLKCTGCWAAEYGNNLSMDFDVLDSIITQGKRLGTYMYIYSGGEPLVRKDDIIKLCEKHDDCMFLAFTNATLIDEKFADEILRVKNFIPAISVEGFEEATDSRRGAGTYKKVVRAMELLKERKLIFGASCCYTSANTQVIGSEEYFDDLIDKGCKFAWFFTYMPIGVGSPTDLMAKPEDREFMHRQVRKFRDTKKLFTMDFWNDGEFVGGCIAGGRAYLHINANGDIEPCAFIHYADCNIHDTALIDAYQSPLFKQYKQNQPFNDNPLRPCPLLDNPGKLAEMVENSGAHSTDLTEKEDVHSLCDKCKTAANNWEPVANRLWDGTLEKSGQTTPHPEKSAKSETQSFAKAR